MKFEVFDMNTGETLHTFRNLNEARECLADMNEGHLDRMYGLCTVSRYGRRRPAMIDVNSSEYERRYAQDMREQAIEEAVAKALCDECYGEGSWFRINQGGAAGQTHSWLKQARAAIAVMRRHM